MAKRIIITVAPDGSISAESTGIQGPACLEDLPTITSMLGEARILSSRLTDEYQMQPARDRQLESGTVHTIEEDKA